MTSDQLFILVNILNITGINMLLGTAVVTFMNIHVDRGDQITVVLPGQPGLQDSSPSAEDGASLRSHWEDHPQASEWQRERSSVLSPILLKPGTSVFSSSQVAPKIPRGIHQPTGDHPGFGRCGGEVHVPDWTGLSMWMSCTPAEEHEVFWSV